MILNYIFAIIPYYYYCRACTPVPGATPPHTPPPLTPPNDSKLAPHDIPSFNFITATPSPSSAGRGTPEKITGGAALAAAGQLSSSAEKNKKSGSGNNPNNVMMMPVHDSSPNEASNSKRS